MSGKCHQVGKFKIRGPNIDEKHRAAALAARPMPPCAIIAQLYITSSEPNDDHDDEYHEKSSTRLFFALLDRCHSNAETAGLRLLLHTKQKSQSSKEPVIPGARLQIRICRRLLRFILRSWITTHFCSPSYLSSDK